MTAHDAALGSATTFTLSGTATVAQADTIHAFNASSALVNYALLDTSAHLLAAINLADPALALASSMAVSGTATVAQAADILAYTGLHAQTATYALADTAADFLSTVDLSIIIGATQVIVTDSPTLVVSDVDNLIFLNANTSFAVGYNLADTGINLLNPLNPGTVTGALLVTVTDTPGLLTAEANTLLVVDHAVFPFGYDLFDFAAELVAAAPAIIHGAGTVTALEPLLAAQASTLHAELGLGAIMSYDLLDTAAHLASAAAVLVTGANLVTVSDTATVAQATIIHNEAPTALYSITDASSTLATALNTGNANLVSVENATTLAVTDASGILKVNANEFGNLLTGPSLLAANDTITIDGVDVNVNLGVLHAFGGNTAAIQAFTLGGASHGSYIVNMGTSGETAVFMEGTGLQNITAASGLSEKFTVGLTNAGGSTISNLEIGDSIDTIGAKNPSLTTQVGSAALVNGAGKWAFAGGALTWWDATTASADHLTLTLAATAHGLSEDANRHSFTVI